MNRRTRMAQLVEDLTEAGEALEARLGYVEQINRGLAEAHRMDRALLSDLSDKLRDQQRQLDDAITIAGEMSVLFPATGELKALAPRQHRESYEAHIPEQVDYSLPISCDPQSFTVQVESLKLLIAKVRPDHLRRSVHAYVRFADEEVAYGISPLALHSMPREKLIRTVTQELGKALGDQLWRALR